MAIRWDKLTVKAQEAVQQANDVAAENGNPELLPVHILAALVRDREGIVPPVLEKIGANPLAIANEAQREIETLRQQHADAPQLPRLLQMITDAQKAKK